MITRRKESDVALPLQLADDALDSKLFRGMGTKLLHVISNENVTYNHHSYGISPGTYLRTKKLRKFFRVLSLNNDEDGKEFISTVEGKALKVY